MFFLSRASDKIKNDHRYLFVWEVRNMSNQLKAFVGHSFTDNDSAVVDKFLKFFTTITKMNIGFSWDHAEEAEAKELAEKVKVLIEDKNLFIGICTIKEAVIDPTKLTKAIFDKKMIKTEKAAFFSKTSDWIIQEIGLAIGLNMDLILLLENGVREPGGLQGNIEYIPFDREAPEKSFNKILEMIKSILPKAKPSFADQTESRAVPEEKDAVEEKQTEDTIELNADSSFSEFRYELFMKVLRGDEEGIKKIKECISSSNLGQEQKKIEDWTAFEEYYRILHGKGGDFIRFEALAKKYPENVHIQKFLALAYKKYDDHYKAAILFKSAAEKSKKSKDIELSLYGNAAISFAKDNRNQEMNLMILKMKSLAIEVENSENELIETIREIAEITNDNDLYFGVIEQLLKINPGDNTSRFNLAYRYSNNSQDELALFHYLKIPHRERDPYSWNNLGVAYQLHNINNNSVKAFKQADQMGNSLAMSNLAKKLITAGFLEEAEEICNRAFKVKDYHKNVLDDVSRIKAIPEQEEKEEKTILEKIKPLSDFYREYGCASLRDNPGNLEGQWRGPLCDLEVKISDDSFTAAGNYELSSAIALNFFSPFTTDSASKKKRYHVKYEGLVFGQTIKGFFIELVDEEPRSIPSATLLGSSETDNKTEVLMILSDSLEVIRVYEKGKNKDFKFYSLKRID
jgi:tetratricopeptide (TPR) repeat protein